MALLEIVAQHRSFAIQKLTLHPPVKKMEPVQAHAKQAHQENFQDNPVKRLAKQIGKEGVSMDRNVVQLATHHPHVKQQANATEYVLIINNL